MRKKGIFAGIVVGLAGLVGCGNYLDSNEIIVDDVVLEEREIKDCVRRISEGSYCILNYDLVCGENGVTYTNNCFACQEVDQYSFGECE